MLVKMNKAVPIAFLILVIGVVLVSGCATTQNNNQNNPQGQNPQGGTPPANNQPSNNQPANNGGSNEVPSQPPALPE